MARNATTKAKPDAAHAQSVDPEAQALQRAGYAEPPFSEQLQAVPGKIKRTSEQDRLQDLLPEIKELAQKVGGFKRLADIAATLEQSKE
jgi:hypothetical protein